MKRLPATRSGPGMSLLAVVVAAALLQCATGHEMADPPCGPGCLDCQPSGAGFACRACHAAFSALNPDTGRCITDLPPVSLPLAPGAADAGADAAAAQPPPFRHIVASDTQLFRSFDDNSAVEESVRNNRDLRDFYNTLDAEGVSFIGDLTEYYEAHESAPFLELYGRGLKMPWFPALGNHEIVQNRERCWSRRGVFDARPKHEETSQHWGSNTCARQALHDLDLWVGQLRGAHRIEAMDSTEGPGCEGGVPGGSGRVTLAYSRAVGGYRFIYIQENPLMDAWLDNSGAWGEPRRACHLKSQAEWVLSQAEAARAAGERAVLLVHNIYDDDSESGESRLRVGRRDLWRRPDTAAREFRRRLQELGVVGIFSGHQHCDADPFSGGYDFTQRLGYIGDLPETTVPVFNAGSSWNRTALYVEFGPGGYVVRALNNIRRGGGYSGGYDGYGGGSGGGFIAEASETGGFFRRYEEYLQDEYGVYFGEAVEAKRVLKVHRTGVGRRLATPRILVNPGEVDAAWRVAVRQLETLPEDF